MRLLDVYQTENAFAVLYDLLAERPKENWISHEKMPTLEEHLNFIAGRPFRLWYVIEEHGMLVGAIEATEFNEIGVAILKKYQRKGLGKRALELFLKMHDPLPPIAARRNGRWLANIATGNRESKSFFRKMGFKPLQETYCA